MSTSKFALQQLSKHGWKEGSGLGKSEDGIKEAIKVKIKHDSHGVGHNKGDEFAFHWWDHVFNKAASNISVNSTQDGVQLSKAKKSDQISTTASKTYDNKAMLYGKFLKGATLSNGNYEATNEGDSADEEESQEDTKTTRIQDLDDAVLLKACGGMTGHKAARHGHKLNGKLARIQEQEALLLAKYKGGKTVQTDCNNIVTEKEKSLDKLKVDGNLQTCYTTDLKEKKKKDKKKEKSERKIRKMEVEECNLEGKAVDTDLTCLPVNPSCEESSDSVVNNTETKKKKKKEKKRKNKEKSEIVEEDNVCEEESSRKKDKKRKGELITTESDIKDSKKKKKNESTTQFSDESETTLSKDCDKSDVKHGATKKKKSKKQKKEKS